jgi:hypothetical protein
MLEFFLEGSSGGVGLQEGRIGRRSTSIAIPPEHHPGAFPDTLRGLYEEYCAGEAADLLSLVPQSGLRDFLRRASAWSKSGGEAAGDGIVASSSSGDELSHDDALAQVRRYARSLLPLPAYEVWVRSYLENRSA